MVDVVNPQRCSQDYDAEIAEEAKPSVPSRSQPLSLRTLIYSLAAFPETCRSYLVTRPQRKGALQARCWRVLLLLLALGSTSTSGLVGAVPGDIRGDCATKRLARCPRMRRSQTTQTVGDTSGALRATFVLSPRLLCKMSCGGVPWGERRASSAARSSEKRPHQASGPIEAVSSTQSQ